MGRILRRGDPGGFFEAVVGTIGHVALFHCE
jgi:hypothetical protein